MPTLEQAFLVSPIRHRAGVFINPLDDPSTFGSFGLGNDADVLQAAIDKSFDPGSPYGDRVEGVFVPRLPGVDLNSQYLFHKTIWQDPPASMSGMRSFLSNPSNPTPQDIEAACQNPAAFGTRCNVVFDDTARTKSDFANKPLWIMGPGNDNTIWRPSLSGGGVTMAPKLRSPFNRGIAVAGGSGGAHVTKIFYPGISNVHTMIEVGPWNTNLGDENYIVNPSGGGYRGIWFTGGQALINVITNPSIVCDYNFGSTTAPYYVDFGQMGISGDNLYQHAAVTAISALTAFTDDWGGYTFTNWSFTADITSPLSFTGGNYWGTTDPQAADPDNGVDRGVIPYFNRFAVELPSFGMVELDWYAYNTSTTVCTFRIGRGWLIDNYRGVDLKADTDFEAELQAALKIAGCHGGTIFTGRAFARNTYSEFNGVTRWCEDGGDFSNMELTGTGITMSQHATKTNDDLALHLCANSQAFIKVGNRNTFFRNCGLLANPIIEGFDRYDDFSRVTTNFDGACRVMNPNMRCVGDLPGSGESPGGGYYAYGSPAKPDYSTSGRAANRMQGFAEFANNPFGPELTTLTPQGTNFLPRAAGGTQRTPMDGTQPAAGHIPVITPGDLAAIKAISSAGTTVSLAGGRLHEVRHTEKTSFALAKQVGDFYSDYVDLTSYPWSFKGQTTKVDLAGCTANQIKTLQPGKKIGLDWGGGVVWAIIKHVYHGRKHITVRNLEGTTGLLPGTKTVTYNGTTIKQETPNVQKFGQALFDETVNTTNATVTTLATIPIATDTTVKITGNVTARRTGGSAGAAGDGASYGLHARVKNVAGTVTISLQGQTDVSEDQAGWDAVFDVSTTNIRVRVTGATNNNISWKFVGNEVVV